MSRIVPSRALRARDRATRVTWRTRTRRRRRFPRTPHSTRGSTRTEATGIQPEAIRDHSTSVCYGRAGNRAQSRTSSARTSRVESWARCRTWWWRSDLGSGETAAAERRNPSVWSPADPSPAGHLRHLRRRPPRRTPRRASRGSSAAVDPSPCFLRDVPLAMRKRRRR